MKPENVYTSVFQPKTEKTTAELNKPENIENVRTGLSGIVSAVLLTWLLILAISPDLALFLAVAPLTIFALGLVMYPIVCFSESLEKKDKNGLDYFTVAIGAIVYLLVGGVIAIAAFSGLAAVLAVGTYLVFAFPVAAIIVLLIIIACK